MPITIIRPRRFFVNLVGRLTLQHTNMSTSSKILAQESLEENDSSIDQQAGGSELELPTNSNTVSVDNDVSDPSSDNDRVDSAFKLSDRKQKNMKADATSKRSMKKLLRFKQLKEMQKYKNKDKCMLPKNSSPGFTEELYGATEYYFENGLRKVYPYHYTFASYAKGRWFNKTVLDILIKEFDSCDPEVYRQSIESGKVLINGEKKPADYKLRNHDLVANTLHRHENPVTDTPIEILEDNEDMLVINKPSSIPCHPCGRYRFNSVPFILGKQHGYQNLRTVYRLDRLTSGVLILTKTAKKTAEVMEAIAQRDVQKEYLARVVGKFPDGTVVCDQSMVILIQKIGIWGVAKKPGKGKACKTTFERVNFNGRSSVVRCIPHTGRTHQIRVHLQYLGYPIVNDPVYNCASFGPERGKGGNYGRPVKEVVDDILKIHHRSLLCEGENPLFERRLQEIKSRTSATSESSKNTVDNSNVSLDSCDTNMEPCSKKMKCANDTVDTIEAESSCEITNSGAETRTSGVKHLETASTAVHCNQATQEGEHPKETALLGFEEEKWIPDEHCVDCKKTYREPRAESLVMFLHALKYKGPDWEYSTPVPDWAKENWEDTIDYSDRTSPSSSS